MKKKSKYNYIINIKTDFKEINMTDFYEKSILNIEIENDNNYTKYFSIKSDVEENKCPVSFTKFFYSMVKKNFNPLKIKIDNGIFYITNKNFFLEELNKKTFDYFRKYPTKIEIVNKILFTTKESLKYENLEQEMEETSIFPYLFKIDEIKDIGNKTIESKTAEIYSGYNVPSLTSYSTKKIHRKKIKINFEEKLDENKSSPEQIKRGFRQILELPETEPFEFDFIIKGYYIYNTETETVEKIEVDKEIKFYNVATSTKRVLELEGFDENEKDEGRTYDEAIGKLFEYLDKMERKKEIDRQEFENFVDEIAFSEKPKIFETLKWYIETNKIGFLELIEGERDRIYISEKEVLKVFEEIFEYESIEISLKEKNGKINEVKERLDSKSQENVIEKNKSIKSKETYDSIRDWLLPLLRKDNKIIFPKEKFLERIKLFDEAEKLRAFNVIKSAVEHENYCVKFEEGKTIRGYEVIKAFGEMLGIVVEEKVVEKMEEKEEEKKLTPQQLRKKKFLERMKKSEEEEF